MHLIKISAGAFSLRRSVVLSVIAWLGCALLGPFGTYFDMSLLARVLFWGVTIALMAPASLVLAHGLRSLLPRFHIVLVLLLATILLTLPAAELIARMHIWVVGSNSVFITEMASPVTETFGIILTMLVIDIIACPLIVERLRTPLAPSAMIRPQAPIFERLSPELQNSRLLSISMEDHYANIVTTAGAEFILLPLKDALGELGDTAGTRIHRSHWIAAEAAVALERDGRKHIVTLHDGRKLPVSQTYLNDVKDLLSSSAAA